MIEQAAPSTVSARLFAEACAVIPGGVNSPVRAFNSVGGTPRFITSAKGCWLTDADGNRYVDLVCSWGPMILGHAHPAVVEAVQRTAANGLSFGAPTPGETELAAAIVDRQPQHELDLGLPPYAGPSELQSDLDTIDIPAIDAELTKLAKRWSRKPRKKP